VKEGLMMDKNNGSELYKDLIDMALDLNDKEWFNKLVYEMKKQKNKDDTIDNGSTVILEDILTIVGYLDNNGIRNISCMEELHTNNIVYIIEPTYNNIFIKDQIVKYRRATPGERLFLSGYMKGYFAGFEDGYYLFDNFSLF
jgi:hypothetical protein